MMTWDWQGALNNGSSSRPASAAAQGARGATCMAAAGRAEPAATQADAGELSEGEYRCVFCRGKGRMAGGGVCPVCSGTGKVLVASPSVRCAVCGGSGQSPPRSNLTCWVCKGRGRVAVTRGAQNCPDCGGRGKQPCQNLPCIRCRGVGSVESDTGPSVAPTVPAELRGPDGCETAEVNARVRSATRFKKSPKARKGKHA